MLKRMHFCDEAREDEGLREVWVDLEIGRLADRLPCIDELLANSPNRVMTSRHF